ncbi:MFS transporter [Lysinibacillus capsici]|uniref:MFS transporter n=1 Tax=Lysinibacillus capsici TaxID=2115968 RepID=UPI002731F3DE|nr:MFS transporter [Lysinibacillus capsici]MDP1392853.1 MFS transporter [Lysinibacillus capsici]MDP1413328.1 MFS transporter [Lysinibacillus capsici]MDP1429737.1 MFS transporter [Lysinibacillus capsici]
MSELHTQLSGGKRNFIFSLLFLAWLVDSLTLFGMNVAIIPISKELHLTQTQSGLVISSFWLSSALMTLLAGWASDKFGSRKIIVIAVFMISLFSLLTGMIGSFMAILAIRFILGLGDGGLPTGSGVAITEIFKKDVRARAKSMLLAAQLIGGVLALYLAGLIADTWGWRTMFYIIGGVGLIVTLLLFKFYNPPKLIKQQVAETSNGRPMKELYKSSFLWMLVVMYFCSSTVHWGFSSWLPSYLEQTRNLNLREVGSLAMIPQACGLIAAIITGFLIDKGLAGKEKIIVLIGAIVSGLCLYMMFNASSIQLAISFQSIFSIGDSAISMAILAIPLKYVSQKIIGSFLGMMYFASGMAGFIAPTAMGALIDGFGGSFQAAFFFLIGALVIVVICAVFYRIPSKNSSLIDHA